MEDRYKEIIIEQAGIIMDLRECLRSLYKAKNNLSNEDFEKLLKELDKK